MVKVGILCNTARSTFSIKFGFIQVNINGFFKTFRGVSPSVCYQLCLLLMYGYKKIYEPDFRISMEIGIFTI